MDNSLYPCVASRDFSPTRQKFSSLVLLSCSLFTFLSGLKKKINRVLPMFALMKVRNGFALISLDTEGVFY